VKKILNLEDHYTDEEGYYHSVYKLTHLPSKKVYIGKHSSKLHPSKDPYVCSSSNKELVDLYKNTPEDFEREILSYHGSSKSAYDEEKLLVPKEVNYGKDNDKYFNLHSGGADWNLHSPEVRSLASKSVMKFNLETYGHVMGKCNSPEVRKKIGKASKLTKEGRYGGAMATCHTEEALEKRFATQLEKYGSKGWANCNTPEVKEKIAEKNRQKAFKIDMKGYVIREFPKFTLAIKDNIESGCSKDWIYRDWNPEFIYLKESELKDLNHRLELKRSKSKLITVKGKSTFFYESSKHKRLHELKLNKLI
jgi:hypothetical protein